MITVSLPGVPSSPRSPGDPLSPGGPLSPFGPSLNGATAANPFSPDINIYSISVTL